MPTTDLFLSPKDVIFMLDISYATLLRRVKNNEIPFIKVGKSLRFPAQYFEGLKNIAFTTTQKGR